MNYKCTELQGATYQPKDSLKFNDYWIIPAWKNASVWQTTDSKLVFLAEEKTANIEDSIYFFVLCYQFIFLRSDIYHYYNAGLNPKGFAENGENFKEIEQKIRMRYTSSDVGCLAPDFNQIDIFHTGLPHPVNFKYIYDHFVELYEKDGIFKDVITLFLDTVGTKHRVYDNIFQQISQLQIIFETILGMPETTKCEACGRIRYVETWTEFQKKKLKEQGIDPIMFQAIMIKEDPVKGCWESHTSIWRLALNIYTAQLASIHGINYYKKRKRECIIMENLNIPLT